MRRRIIKEIIESLLGRFSAIRDADHVGARCPSAHEVGVVDRSRDTVAVRKGPVVRDPRIVPAVGNAGERIIARHEPTGIREPVEVAVLDFERRAVGEVEPIVEFDETREMER